MVISFPAPSPPSQAADTRSRGHARTQDCWAADPTQRPSFAQLTQRLELLEQAWARASQATCSFLIQPMRSDDLGKLLLWQGQHQSS